MQWTASDMRISDWSSDVFSSDLTRKGLETYDHRHGWNKVEQHFDLAEDEDAATAAVRLRRVPAQNDLLPAVVMRSGNGSIDVVLADASTLRSEEHTSELQSLMRTAYAVFCLKNKQLHHH